MLEAKTNNSSNESLSADEMPKANNRNNLAIDKEENATRQRHTDTSWSGPLIRDRQPSVLRNSYVKP